MQDKLIRWIKDPQTWGFFVSIAVMAIISIAFFYPDNFDGNTLNQADMSQGLANGHEGQAYEQATGEKALWTNSLFSGMPTFQISPSYSSNSLFNWINSLYGLFLPSPSNLLFMMMLGFLVLLYCMKIRWWIALIGAVAWGFSSYYIIIIGAGHIWKFITLTYIPPTIGGLILCYRGRYVLGGALTALFAMLQLNANHPQMTYYFAFVMLGFVIVYLIELMQQKKAKQWVVASCVVLGAGALALGANLPSLYNTYEYAKETKRSQSELTPITTADNDSPGERPTGGLPKSQIVGWSYGGSEMMSLLVPNVKGGASAKPVKGQIAATSMSQIDAARNAPYEVGQLLPYFSQYFNDSEGTNGPVYVGAVIFALFLLGCFIVKGPMKWMLLILTLISVLLALGRNFSSLTDFMIYNFPLYSKFRAVESILVIAEFTMPLLAILAIAKVLKPLQEPQKGKKGQQAKEIGSAMTWVFATFGVCACCCLLLLAAPSMLGSVITQQDMSVVTQIQQAYPDYNTQPLLNTLIDLRYGMIKADAMRSLIFIALAGAVLIIYLRGKANDDAYNKRRAMYAAAALGVLVLVDLFQVDKRYLSHESFVGAPANAQNAVPNELLPDAIDQAILQDKSLSYRVMDIPGFWLANRSYHHKMIGGYHAAKLNRYEDLIQRRMTGVQQVGYIPELRIDSIAQMYAEQNPELVNHLLADYRVLDMLNARYIITGDKEYPVEYNDYALGNAWLVDEINYVDDANAEMTALETLDPSHQAVADKKFMEVLGQDIVKPVAGDTIALTAYTPNKLTYKVDTKSGGLAVFSEVYFPWGWKAEIDGNPTPLGRVNYVLRAMRVPAGAHEITMQFDPESMHTTIAIAYACVTLIYLWLIAGVWVAWMRKEE